jgi:uncharacterized protein (DUF305 family)
MSWHPAFVGVAVAALGLAAASAEPRSADASEQAFLAQNRTAMARMMAGMQVAPSHDIDQDFAAMMIPHHQGAVDMAVLELRYGKNEQLRRIAQEIIVDQQQEIAAMRLALGRPPPPPSPAPTQASDAMSGMDMPAETGR